MPLGDELQELAYALVSHETSARQHTAPIGRAASGSTPTDIVPTGPYLFAPGFWRIEECSAHLPDMEVHFNMKTERSRFGSVSLAVLAAGLLVAPAVAQTQQVTDPETVSKILKGFQAPPGAYQHARQGSGLGGLRQLPGERTSNCDICHSAGTSTQFAAGGNPCFGQHATVVNGRYLSGRRPRFWPVSRLNGGPSSHIMSRNLISDSSGLPPGGTTLQQFMQIMRTGLDPDHVHPTCAGTPDGKCIRATSMAIFSGSCLGRRFST
jgi:hypothetical protein